MKFYELDLRQIIPYGIPLNTASQVEYVGYINDFFLQGFESYFSRLFTVENNELSTDYSRSCTAPNSLFACQFCTDSQIEAAITEAGFIYYPTNKHNVNAKFMYDLNNNQFGTEGMLTAIAKYVANSSDVTAEPIYENKEPYHYGIYLSGDIASSANTGTILSRMIDHLQVVGTAHTQVDEFAFEDTSSKVKANAAVAAIDVGVSCEVTIPLLYDVWINSYGNGKLSLVKAVKDYFSIGLREAKTIVDETPTALSSFNNLLSGAGGPYVQSQAQIVVDDLLDAIHEYEPNWDGSFGIRLHTT